MTDTQQQPPQVTREDARAVSSTVPEKPALEGLEAKWSQRWRDEHTHAFDRSRSRAEIYAIDTPPPTVSGTLHFGSVCSYTQCD
ncbi:MAG: hypothetical protein ACRDPB_01280, partial [Nocardioidaceae bacterium]